jgi:urease accessory protein
MTITTMAEDALYHLMSWMSPAYPVGAFAHSSGLEWAVDAGWVTNRAELENWLRTVLESGAGWNDAALFAAAHRAAMARDRATLGQIAELAAALYPSSERRVESLSQGGAFRRAAAATMPVGAFQLLDEVDEEETAYPIAVAVLAAGQHIVPAVALTAYLHGYSANLVSAGQRLIPLGQTDAQATMLALKPIVLDVVERAVALPPGDPFRFLGSAAILADAASMWHETQYTRLFRT